MTGSRDTGPFRGDVDVFMDLFVEDPIRTRTSRILSRTRPTGVDDPFSHPYSYPRTSIRTHRSLDVGLGIPASVPFLGGGELCLNRYSSSDPLSLMSGTKRRLALHPLTNTEVVTPGTREKTSDDTM